MGPCPRVSQAKPCSERLCHSDLHAGDLQHRDEETRNLLPSVRRGRRTPSPASPLHTGPPTVSIGRPASARAAEAKDGRPRRRRPSTAPAHGPPCSQRRRRRTATGTRLRRPTAAIAPSRPVAARWQRLSAKARCRRRWAGLRHRAGAATPNGRQAAAAATVLAPLGRPRLQHCLGHDDSRRHHPGRASARASRGQQVASTAAKSRPPAGP